jgi:hypothetical protein
MKIRPFLCFLAVTSVSIAGLNADPILLAHTQIAGTASDLSGLSTPLENGVAGNLLGGFGSGIGYAGGNTFVAVPDRGPNAVTFNPLVDNTASYIDRFQTFQMTLTPSGSGLPFTLAPKLTGTTLLSSATPLVYGTGALGTGMSGGTNYTLGSGVPALNATNHTNYFTGRSDNFNAALSSLNPNNARLDPESIRVSNDGKFVFISDEYGPYVNEFNRATGQRVRSFTLPSYYGVSNLSAQGDTEISGNTSGRIANKGMEGLAITPDGKTLVGIMQSPLIQDGGSKGTNIRLATIDIASGNVTHEYVYNLSSNKETVSEIVAVNDHQFLVDERDGNSGTDAKVKQYFLIDTNGATDVAGKSALPSNFTAVSKGANPFLNMLNPAYGLNNADFPQKIESIAFGPDITLNGSTEHTIWVGNDNDFDPTAPNNLYVFGFTNTDLPGYQAQPVTATPEPASIALLALGGALVCLRRSRKAL